MKHASYLAAFLAVVACLSALLLTAVNDLTAPIIKQREIAAVAETLKLVFPQATSFDPKDLTADADKAITGWYYAEGYGDIFEATVDGYGGTGSIVFMVGIDTQGKYTGFTIITNNDSAGFGQRLTKEYAALVDGVSAGQDPDVLTGATKSSTAVRKGLQSIYAYWSAHKG